MKIARFSINDGARFGVLNEETGRYHLLNADPLYSGFEQSGQVIAPSEAHFVAPMLPRSKVIGFQSAFSESDLAESGFGAYFKPNTSVVGTDVPVSMPNWAKGQGLSVTPQLGLVVSRLCKDVPESMAADVIFGYLLVTDVSVPELAAQDPVQAFGFDTSCPSGPILETGLPSGEFAFAFDAGENGYDGVIHFDLQSLARRIAFASQVATLLPGDIILTGALGEKLRVQDGDEIVFENTALGVLRNPVLK
ncbi:fumarylacetoacetate hydrolase family protein [Arcanobacterium hippocoleae]|uniref:fumarylacetoacetate hydrolase family protein n=1 Tax=Arcanobacterium hippocoleae TaxID=149017 RepID=UPI0033423F0A